MKFLEEVPKALLPVANRPVLSFVLEQLELSNLKDLIVVVEGQDAALCVGGWIYGAYADCLHVEVVSGDLVSDVPPGAIAAAHRRHEAVVTAMLCSTPVSGPSDSGSSGGKDKTKKPGRYNKIGMDPTKQFLLYVATGVMVYMC